MPFLLSTTNRNFSTSLVHVCTGLETDGTGQLVVVVSSFATMEAFDAKALNWQDRHPLPVAAFPAVAGDPQAWLISPEGPFSGATVLVEATPLERLQSLKWAQIKGERDRRETGGMLYLGAVFDADERSFLRMVGAAAEAQDAIARGLAETYSKAWKLADNTLKVLNAAEVAGLPVAVAAHASALHATAQVLFERIHAEDADAGSVAAISWPT